MRLSKIPMTHAAGIGPLPEMLAAVSGKRSVDRVMKGEGLPQDIATSPRLTLPVASVVSLFERASIEAGDRCFGARVGRQMKPGSFGPWVLYGAAAPSLGEALWRMNRSIQVFQTGAKISLHEAADGFVWGYEPSVHPRGGIQHADHVLPVLLQFVRAYLGDNWQPRKYCVRYSRDVSARELEMEFDTEIEFDSSCNGLSLDQSDLLAKRRNDPDDFSDMTFQDLLSQQRFGEDIGALAPIRQILHLRLLSGCVDLEGAARMARVGPRSLQRHLQSTGITYRQLLEQVRTRRAAGLLRESDRSITDIAFALGYTEPGNFTRAFRRITGCSPADYRKETARRPHFP